MIKVCFRCKKEVTPKCPHYAMKEMENGKEIRVDYVHKQCWHDFCNTLNGATASLAKSNYLLNALGGHMKKFGMIQDEEIVL
jgi:hypothetical protein